MNRAVSLYRLQQLDIEEEEARARLSQIDASMGETDAVRQARQATLKTSEEARHWAVQQQDLELQVGTLKRKIADSEQRLYGGSIRNPKELADLQAEVASLQRRLEQTEGGLLEAMIARDEAEANAEAATEHLGLVEREWAASQESLTNERGELEARLEQVGATRAALLPTIPADDLDTYNSLRRRKGGLAVATLQSGACTSCGMEVPSGHLARGQREGLLLCDNCGRILYSA